MYKRFTTVAGRTIITRYTDSSRIKTEKGRKPKRNPTPAAVAKVNAINQERNLTIEINHNFGAGDLWVVLAYPVKATIEEAMKQIERFKRNLRNLCKRKGIPYKLIESTGIGSTSGKPHHHIVVNSEVTRDMITKYWAEEFVHIETLWSSGNYNRVAKYMLKNALSTKDKRGNHKKAWRSSRTIVKPETKKEEMKRRPFSRIPDPEDLTPRKGYAIDRDSIRIYQHAITEETCIEYIEVALTEEPRLKRYSKGKAAERERWYPEMWDEQITMGEIEQEAM